MKWLTIGKGSRMKQDGKQNLEQQKHKPKNSLMKQTAVCSLLFSVATLGLIFYMSGRPAVAIEDIAQDEIQRAAMGEEGAGDGLVDRRGNLDSNGLTDTVNEPVSAGTESGSMDGYALTFALGGADTTYLSIPLPPGTGAEQVTIENHYMDEEMWVVVQGMAAEFYETAAVSGNRKNITAGTYKQEQTGTVLKFALDDVYEYRNILEEDKLYIEFVAPREMYDRIIVVDPAFGGSETGYSDGTLKEKDIALAIAGRLKEKLDQEAIKVYYTRMDDNNLSEEKRVKIANNTKADMLIRIEANADEDSMVNGTTAIYNEDFFIPGFGSIELADILEQEVVSNIKGKAVGLAAATETDYVIRNATVPAATIKVGYLTNAQEAILLKKDDYIEKIAVGIYHAIMKVYEKE